LISEALQLHLPVIVECNGATLPQERYNAAWVTENEYGMSVKSFKKIAPAVCHLLQSENFNKFSRNVSAYSNRALFEIPAILETILQKRPLAVDSFAIHAGNSQLSVPENSLSN
jgi:1,2-diacylglycerol 3-beta-galactosyltransferase